MQQETDARGNNDYYVRTATGDLKTHTNRGNQTWQYLYDRARRATDEVYGDNGDRWTS